MPLMQFIHNLSCSLAILPLIVPTGRWNRFPQGNGVIKQAACDGLTIRAERNVKDTRSRAQSE